MRGLDKIMTLGSYEIDVILLQREFTFGTLVYAIALSHCQSGGSIICEVSAYSKYHPVGLTEARRGEGRTWCNVSYSLQSRNSSNLTT